MATLVEKEEVTILVCVFDETEAFIEESVRLKGILNKIKVEQVLKKKNNNILYQIICLIACLEHIWYDHTIVKSGIEQIFFQIVEVDAVERITKEQVRHVAKLARLEFKEEKIEQLAYELDEIISFAEQLNELDTDNVEPTSHVLDVRNVLREDEVKPSLSREETMKNAPDQKDGQFKVPSVLE